MSKDIEEIEYHDISYENIVNHRGTPFIYPPRVILTWSPTTAAGNFPPLHDPYPGYPISTARILIRPDEHVRELRLEKVSVSLRGYRKIQAVLGRVPMAMMDLDVGIDNALKNLDSGRLRSLTYLLKCALLSGSRISEMGGGYFTYIFNVVPGASGAGWAQYYNKEFNTIFNTINRRSFKILVIQISTDLRIDDLSKERRIKIIKELMDSFNLRLFISYPKYMEDGNFKTDHYEAKMLVNDLISFIEYVASSEFSDVARQFMDLGLLFQKEGVVGYILSAVMGTRELTRVINKPSTIRLLSSIPIRIELENPVVLIILAPNRSFAERYTDEFRRAFKRSEVVATYSNNPYAYELQPRFIIGIPLMSEGLEGVLTEIGKGT